MKPNKRMVGQGYLKSQRGMTLVELLVAAAVGLILLGGIYQVFVSSTTAYSYNDQLVRLQENGRFAVEFMARDVRVAGYTGCRKDVPVTNTLNNAGTLPYNFSVGVSGFDNLATPLPGDLTAAGISPNLGTDVLILRGQTTSDSVAVTNNNSSAQIFLDVTGVEPNACSDGTDRVSGICKGDILMIADCRKARVFQAGTISVTGGGGTSELNVTHPASGTPGNSISSWGGAGAPEDEQFGTDSEVVRYTTKTYFIQNDAAGRPGLYRKYDADPPEELIPGVETLQVLYGEDSNDDDNVDSYVTAAAVTDWAAVMAVRIGLLLRSPGEIGKKALDTSTYLVNGETVDPLGNGSVATPADDRRMRQVYVSTVGIRNRLP